MEKYLSFSVNTRLTKLLGETYRSSEVALKELVDNAWDADATKVWIELPELLSKDPLTVRDNGTGMTPLELETQYLNIASDKRTRTGERTPKFNRKIKGRKGVGKFAGLTIASKMTLKTLARNITTEITIDKKAFLDAQVDLENVPIPLLEAADKSEGSGTTLTLYDLDDRLNFPTPERLKHLLAHEYGREDSFQVFVNDELLSVQHVSGSSHRTSNVLLAGGNLELSYTISDQTKSPKFPGIVLKVDGKTVGRPSYFGLEDDEDIPPKLLKKLVGEVSISGIEDFVTADWGAVLENSKSYREAQKTIASEIKAKLQIVHTNEMQLQKARLQKQINKRLEKLPEYRREFASAAISRILARFYGESDEKVSTIAGVALDALEHDAYWEVLAKIHEASKGEIGAFADSLNHFGLLELATVAQHANQRLEFLEYLEKLVTDVNTREMQVHTAIETNLWILGRSFATMASNKTLKNMIEALCGEKFKGPRANKRPDLLLSQDYADSYLLIEFKRPDHPITRDDIAQAEKYRDDLIPKLSSQKTMKILMMGKGSAPSLNHTNLSQEIEIKSFMAIISAARSELQWVLNSLGS